MRLLAVVRGTDSQPQEPGTNPVLGGAGDVDPLSVQFNCQNGDLLDF